MRRFFASLLIVFVFTGCPKKEQSDETDPGFGPGGEIISVPMPTAEILAALGPENNIPIHRLLPDPVFVAVGNPKRFLDSPVSTGGEWVVAETIAEALRYSIDPNSIERFVQSAGIPATVFVNVPNPQSPMAMPIARPFQIPRRVTIITFSTAVDKSLLAASILGGDVDPAALETRKRTEGRNEYYDISDTSMGIPQWLVFGMMDECTAVIVEGVENDVKSVFSDTIPKNAVLDRLKHTPVDTNDLTVLTSLEGVEMSPELLEGTLMQFSEIGIIPISFVQAVTQHLRALTLSLNASAVVGQPILSAYAEGRDEAGAEVIGDAIRHVQTFGQTTLLTMSDSAKQALPIPAEFATALLNAITVEVIGTRINVTLNNFETLIPTVNGWVRNRQAAMEHEVLARQRVVQLRGLVEIFVAYYRENGKFPSDIVDAEGKPLLSWRVHILPMVGLGELYGKFKLDEPWDSETNREAMETVPRIFAPFVPEIPVTKTVVRFFDSPGTPFANKDLKIEDITLPQNTLMFVVVSPEYAVEWTKPESLKYDADKIPDIFGELLLGVSFIGQMWEVPIPPESDPEFEKTKQDIEALIRGTPLDSSALDSSAE
ncbi:MAG: DUF1559 domain-containing protein [Planctomycetaceae bacterium]|nr:DUF1559 domain-containing protein [Planctomycetaceae bacterium]